MYWNVLVFVLRVVVAAIPALSWFLFFYELSRHFVSSSPALQVGLFFVGFVCLMPLVVVYGIYLQMDELGENFKQLIEKEGLSYQDLSGRELKGLFRIKFPLLYSSLEANKFFWWFLITLLPWVSIFTFYAGRASGNS